MATLAEVNMTLQEQGMTLRETHQTLLDMLQEDIDARKKEERAAGDRREKEREAKNKRQGPPSVKGMGSGEAFTRGLLGDKMFGSLDNLMSMAFGAAGGLIPFAFKNVGRGLKFGAAALALNSLTESAVDFAFEQLEKIGITGLTPDQKAKVAEKAETAVNAGFVAKFLGLGNKASLAVALGAAFGEEIGVWLGGVIDDQGNMRLKVPFAEYMGYPEGEITLGPTGQAALGAISLYIGQKILGRGVTLAHTLLKNAPKGFWTRVLKGMTGVTLAQMAQEAILKDGVKAVPQPSQFNERGRGQITYPQRAAPPSAVTQGKPTVGRDPKTGRFTSLKNTVPNAFNEPGRGRITYPQAANANIAPKQPKNMAEWLRSADQKVVNSRAFQKALPILKVMAKAAPWAAFAVFLNEFVTIINSDMSVKQKRIATARLIGGTFQVTVIAAFGAAVGAAGATALGITAGWGTVIGLIAGGAVGYASPNVIGDMLAAMLVGDNEPADKANMRAEQLLMQRGTSDNALEPMGFYGSTADESASFFESVKNDPNYAPRAFELRQNQIKQMSMYGSRYRAGPAGRNLSADLGIGFTNRDANALSLFNEKMRLNPPQIIINNDNSTTDNSSAYKAEGNRYLTGTGMTATDLKYDKMYMGIKGFGGSVGQVF